MNGTELEVVDQYIYLGVTFKYNNFYYKSIERQISQTKKAMFSLITKSRRLDVPFDITLDLFEKLVLPILIYGSEVWGHSNLKPIYIFYRKKTNWEKVQVTVCYMVKLGKLVKRVIYVNL